MARPGRGWPRPWAAPIADRGTNAMKSAGKILAIGLLAALLLAIAWAAALVQSRGTTPPPHDFASFLSANALAVTVVLATAAFVLFLVQRSGQPLPGWLGFWTSALAAFLVDIVAGGAGAGGHVSWVDAAVAAWWGLDLVLVWSTGTM